MKRFSSFFLNSFRGDPIIWGIFSLFSMFGILVVYSTTSSLAYRHADTSPEYYLARHVLLTVLSFFVAWVVHRVDYRYFYRISTFCLWIAVPLLLFTLGFGVTLNEATRWVSIPYLSQTFQPSDFAKLSLFTYIAGALAISQRDQHKLASSLFSILSWLAVICGLTALSDISSAVLIFCTAFLLFFMGRVPLRYLFMLLVIGGVCGAGVLMVSQRSETATRRIQKFLGTSRTFQNEQAYVAIADGGLLGKGPGNSDQKNFLPHAYSDFVYAIVVEEYGALGALFLMVGYLMLVYRGTKVMRNSQRFFGGLLSTSLCVSIVWQALVNMSVAMGLLPVTGLTLPMVSMGGTSQLFTGISLGMVLSVSRSAHPNEDSDHEILEGKYEENSYE